MTENYLYWKLWQLKLKAAIVEKDFVFADIIKLYVRHYAALLKGEEQDERIECKD